MAKIDWSRGMVPQGYDKSKFTEFVKSPSLEKFPPMYRTYLKPASPGFMVMINENLDPIGWLWKSLTYGYWCVSRPDNCMIPITRNEDQRECVMEYLKFIGIWR